eukprot:SAG11_NODE_2110_length_3805_cov_4.091203_5_plen_227_part_00
MSSDSEKPCLSASSKTLDSPVFEALEGDDGCPDASNVHAEQTEHSLAVPPDADDKPAKQPLRTGSWSTQESAMLRKAVVAHKFNWTAVALSVGRSKASCRHRWHDHEVKHAGQRRCHLGTSEASKRSGITKHSRTSSSGRNVVPENCKNLLRTSLLARRIPVENSAEQVASPHPMLLCKIVALPTGIPKDTVVCSGQEMVCSGASRTLHSSLARTYTNSLIDMRLL